MNYGELRKEINTLSVYSYMAIASRTRYAADSSDILRENSLF